MSVNQKYLKDENGEVFSPITSMNSIYDNNGKSLVSIINGMPTKYKITSWAKSYSISLNSNEGCLVVIDWAASIGLYFCWRYGNGNANCRTISEKLVGSDSCTYTQSSNTITFSMSNTGQIYCIKI